jgi:hypothetical protein
MFLACRVPGRLDCHNLCRRWTGRGDVHIPRCRKLRSRGEAGRHCGCGSPGIHRSGCRAMPLRRDPGRDGNRRRRGRVDGRRPRACRVRLDCQERGGLGGRVSRCGTGECDRPYRGFTQRRRRAARYGGRRRATNQCDAGGRRRPGSAVTDAVARPCAGPVARPCADPVANSDPRADAGSSAASTDSGSRSDRADHAIREDRRRLGRVSGDQFRVASTRGVYDGGYGVQEDLVQQDRSWNGFGGRRHGNV